MSVFEPSKTCCKVVFEGPKLVGIYIYITVSLVRNITGDCESNP